MVETKGSFKNSFLSLRWKTFGLLLAVLLSVQFGYSWFSYHTLLELSEADHKEREQIHQGVLYGLMDASYERMLETAQLLLAIQIDPTEQQAGIDNLEQFSLRIEKIFPDLAVSGSFDAVGIFDNKAHQLKGWGNRVDIDRAQIFSVLNSEIPVRGIVCDVTCLRYVAVPVLIDKQLHVLVIAKYLADLVLAFKQQIGVDVGIALESELRNRRFDQLQVLLMTNRHLAESVLPIAYASAEGLRIGPNVIEIGPATYKVVLGGLPGVVGEQAYWLSISDISEQQQALTNELIASLSVSVVGLLLAAVLQLILLSRPMKRLATIANLLPKLGRHEYKDVRDELRCSQPQFGVFNDELTVLHASTEALTDQLEQLEKSVSERTQGLHQRNDELRQERNFVSSLLDNAQVVVLTQNDKSIITSLNHYGHVALDIAEDQLNSLSFAQLHADRNSWAEHHKLLSGLLEGEQQQCHFVSVISIQPSLELDIVWRHCLLETSVEGDARILSIGTDITEYKRVERHLYWLANHDPLTECPNRLLFNSHLEKLLAASDVDTPVALLFFDLDSFKDINDSLGHPIGDELLKQVVKRIQWLLPDESMLARQGGDEFTITLSNTGLEAAKDYAQRVVNLLREPFEIQGYEVFSTTSIGIAVYPDHAADSVALVKNADSALFEAKANGKDNFFVFDNDQASRKLERFAIINDLRQALEKNQFVLHYQPKVDAVNGHVIGAEALIRWQHPEQGFISPVRFIPLAEELGLIISIGEWVLRQACSDLVKWVDAGNEPFIMAVNIAGQQVIHERLLPMVEEALQDFSLDPAYLELEVTESFLLKQPEMAAKKLQALRDMGIHLSMDDFGTGFSSLSYLKRLPLDMLKIDRSFILGIGESKNDESIINTIIALCHSMNIGVLAEGVESRKQLDFLLERDCKLIQGYLFSKPIPFDDLCDFMRAFNTNEDQADLPEPVRS